MEINTSHNLSVEILKEIKIKTDVQSALILLDGIKRFQKEYNVKTFPQLLLDFMINQEMASIKMNLETRLLRTGHKSKDELPLKFSVQQVFLMVTVLDFTEEEIIDGANLLHAINGYVKQYSHLLLIN